MDNMLDVINDNSLVLETARLELESCNEFSEQFGLSLNENQIDNLIKARSSSLKAAGRVEFGGGILPKLIYAFCDSPFVNLDNYELLLTELQEAFYYYKTDSEDSYLDDELIEFMVSVFNGRAQGSVEYLIGTSLEDLARYARMGYDATDGDEVGDLF